MENLTTFYNNNDNPTILKGIINDKINWVAQKQRVLPLQQFKSVICKSDRDFYAALLKNKSLKPAYILECKKASPSKGLIREDFDLPHIANTYKNYASAISVLTDEKYFQGDFSYIKQVRDLVSQPILCKDFIISTYQVYLARYYQADAILLMLSVIDDETYQNLARLSHQLGMGVLTEVSNQQELDRAIALNAQVIGINNRNLHDLTVDLTRTIPLAKQVPDDRIIISESGIYCHQQIKQLQSYVQGFLIGSSLMTSDHLDNTIRKIIFGENKVCGLTRSSDAELAYQHGALYGGLIFTEHSPRKLTLTQAQSLTASSNLLFVGIFQNQSEKLVSELAHNLNLHAVQLHGNEDQHYIAKLHAILPKSCQIWRAISIDITQNNALEIEDNELITRYILDSKHGEKQGGTGVSFNWSIVPEKLKKKAILAGGINPENISTAINQGFLGVDINSGIEVSAGIKSPEKLQQCFTAIINNNR